MFATIAAGFSDDDVKVSFPQLKSSVQMKFLNICNFLKWNYYKRTDGGRNRVITILLFLNSYKHQQWQKLFADYNLPQKKGFYN